MDPKTQIQNTYIDFLVREMHRPPTFEAFCMLEALETVDVQEYYTSFLRIERDILLETFRSTLERLSASPEYTLYSAREKLLAFFYTWLEELAEIRTFLYVVDDAEVPALVGVRYLKAMEMPFKAYVQEVLAEGKENGEVASRIMMTDYYPKVFWLKLRFLLHYWLNDESEDFSQTDAAVEKAINFAFDLVAPNVLDSGFDFVKFLIKR